jgi:hypothetical protein
MYRSRWIVVTFIALFGLVTLLVLPGRYSFQSSNGCAPTPQERYRLGLATITPDARWRTTPGPSGVSFDITPISIAETIDLSPEMPQRDKAQVIVFRCDGRFVRYWVPGMLEEAAVELGPGDVLFFIVPAESLFVAHVQIHVTEPTVEILLSATPHPVTLVTPFPTETPRSYPPVTPVPTSTPMPYDP